MISRTYVVVMAPVESGDPTAPVDILVQSDPGSPDAKVTTADGAVYWEVRGRSLRFETLAADGTTGGFVPRLNLGFSIAVACLGSTNPSVVPAVELSESLSTVVEDATGSAFADPGGEPVIRLASQTEIASVAFLVSLQVMEAKDEGHTASGV